MAMLDRYRKPGGFKQLLALIETFWESKQEKFISMIEEENKRWAQAIRAKMLTIDRIFSWDDQVLAEICKRFPPKNLACAMQGLSSDQKQKILNLLSHGEKRKLDAEASTLTANQQETVTNLMKFIEVTRTMINDGEIRLDKVDQELGIPDNMEELLNNLTGFTESAEENTEDDDFTHQTDEAAHKEANSGAAVQQLKRQVNNLLKEVNQLKTENRIMRDKLEQIKKIA